MFLKLTATQGLNILINLEDVVDIQERPDGFTTVYFTRYTQIITIIVRETIDEIGDLIEDAMLW